VQLLVLLGALFDFIRFIGGSWSRLAAPVWEQSRPSYLGNFCVIALFEDFGAI